MLICGCSLIKHGIKIQPALANINPNQDANAVKVQGDIAPIKAPIRASLENEINAQPQAGANNTATHQSVGGSMITKETQVNDSALIKYMIGSLAGIIIVLIGLLTKKEMNESHFRKQQEETEDKILSALLAIVSREIKEDRL